VDLNHARLPIPPLRHSLYPDGNTGQPAILSLTKHTPHVKLAGPRVLAAGCHLQFEDAKD
jgi:hypothetical protein